MVFIADAYTHAHSSVVGEGRLVRVRPWSNYNAVDVECEELTFWVRPEILDQKSLPPVERRTIRFPFMGRGESYHAAGPADRVIHPCACASPNVTFSNVGVKSS
jgi:hypothetical protein